MTDVKSCNGQIVTESTARFTIVARECVRMEYSPAGVFVDDPTLFACNRDACLGDYEYGGTDGGIFIDTGAMRVEYRPDGEPFSENNLSVSIRCGLQRALWFPGKSNDGNLGGTRATLDGFVGEGGVGEGLLSREGWCLTPVASWTGMGMVSGI